MIKSGEGRQSYFISYASTSKTRLPSFCASSTKTSRKTPFPTPSKPSTTTNLPRFITIFSHRSQTNILLYPAVLSLSNEHGLFFGSNAALNHPHIDRHE